MSEKGEDSARLVAVKATEQSKVNTNRHTDSNFNIYNIASKPQSKVNSRWKTNPLFHRQTNFVQQNKMNQSIISKPSLNVADLGRSSRSIEHMPSVEDSNLETTMQTQVH